MLFEQIQWTQCDLNVCCSTTLGSSNLVVMDAEISRQKDKLEACQKNLNRFHELEKQMEQLTHSLPVPNVDEQALAEDETIMEIREELDEHDNIVAATVLPQNAQAMQQIAQIMQADDPGRVPIIETDTTKAASTTSTERTNDLQPDEHDMAFEPPSVPVSSPNDKLKKKKKKKSAPAEAKIVELPTETETQNPPVSDHVIERLAPHQAEGSFNIRETADGRIEITDDPDGYSIGILPEGLAEMTSIVNEMDWERAMDEDGEEDESEDEYGRTKHRGMIPLPGILRRPASSQDARDHIIEHQRRNSADLENIPPSSARGRKKKLVFADKLVQGPSAGTNKNTFKSVLRKTTSYPFTPEYDNELPVSPTIGEPKISRFKLERSSTDTKISLLKHALPSEEDQAQIDGPVSNVVREREANADLANDSSIQSKSENLRVSSSDHTNLYPNKINLAGIDLAPEAGTVKGSLSVPKLSEEALAAIRKKRESMGKKHRRRKSADPNYPARSSSWDESQPLPKPHRRPSSGELESPAESLKAARLTRAKEILRAQDDIAWANAPITPDDVTESAKTDELDPMDEAGDKVDVSDGRQASAVEHASESVKDELKSLPLQSPAEPPQENGSELPDGGKSDTPTCASQETSSSSPPAIPPSSVTERVLSPRPRKPPTPERRGSYANIPSPLSQEIQPHTLNKEVQFTSDVIRRLEPLMEDNSEPSVVLSARKERKMPLRKPSRQSSIDPQTISPTPGSPPPENRQPGPLRTEEDGAVSHYMVRATSKSPPPHIAIHDLLGDTPENVRLAMREESITPTPQYRDDPAESHDSDDKSIDSASSVAGHPNGKNVSKDSGPVISGGIVERHPPSSSLSVLEGDERAEDEIDEQLHRKEIAHEYHRLRSRMIGREGGFVKEEEGPIVPLDEDDEAAAPKLSRFKAARLGNKSME